MLFRSAKSGTVIPLSLDEGNSVANPTSLKIDIYNGEGEYTLYEDNELGVAAFTTFKKTSSLGYEAVDVSFKGDLSVLPAKRSMSFVFRNIVVNTSVDMAIGLTEKRSANVKVYKNGEPITAEISKYGEVKVALSDIDYSATYTVEVSYSTLDPLASAKRTTLLKLMTAEGTLDVRKNLSKDIEAKCQSVEAVKNMILRSHLSASEKARLIESL